MNYAVIGLGEFGRNTALELERLGNKVIGVDVDAKEVELVSDSLNHVVIADATSIHTLEDINAIGCDGVLVSIGDDLEASLLCVVNLLKLKCENIWVKTKNDAHRAILTALGVTHIVNPERDMGVRMAQMMNYPSVKDYMALDNERFMVKFQASSVIIGQSIGEAQALQKEVTILIIERNGELITDFDEFMEIEEGDQIVCLGRLDGLKTMSKLLKS